MMNDLRASNSFPADEPGGMQDNKRNIWQVLVEPASALEGQEARRQAQLLSSLLVVLIPLISVGAVTSALTSTTTEELLAPAFMGIVAIFLLGAYILSRTERYVWGATLALAAFAFLPYAIVIAWGGSAAGDLGIILMWTVMPLLLSSIFLPIWGTAVLAAANVLVLLLLPFFVPDLAMGDVGSIVGFVLGTAGALLLSIRNRNVLEDLRRAELVESNRELQAIRASLEERVLDRTQDLERRTRYLEATATVARNAALELDIRELLSRTVASVSEQFGFYHTGLFFLEPSGEGLALQAASSEGGQRMVERGHRLRVGEGIVGYAAQYRQYRLALNVGEDAIFFDNPDLPETRSEVALPLQARGELVGVLDVQSTEPQAFSDEDVAALEALADQVAVALSNARLFWEAQQALEAERRVYGEIGREEWQRLLHARRDLGYRYTGQTVLPVGQAEASPDDGDGEELPALSLPVRHLGQKLGTIVAHKPADAGEWTPQETELMATLAEQLSLALDSARLYEDTQRREAQERLVGEVTAAMRQTLEVETVLQTAVDEIAGALGLAALDLRLGLEPDSNNSATPDQLEE